MKIHRQTNEMFANSYPKRYQLNILDYNLKYDKNMLQQYLINFGSSTSKRRKEYDIDKQEKTMNQK